MGGRALRSYKYLGRSGPCRISQVPWKVFEQCLEWFYHKQAIQIYPNETLVRIRQRWEMRQLLYWSETYILNFYFNLNFQLLPITTLNDIDCWLCTSSLQSLGLHLLTLVQVIWQWDRTWLKLQNLICNSMSHLACI